MLSLDQFPQEWLQISQNRVINSSVDVSTDNDQHYVARYKITSWTHVSSSIMIWYPVLNFASPLCPFLNPSSHFL